MPENDTYEPFDWSFGSLVRHFVIWLAKALAPAAAFYLWFIALAAFPGLAGTRAVCAAGALAMLLLTHLSFSFERTGVIALDVFVCVLNEAVILLVLFLAFLISALGKGTLHTDSFLGVVLLLAAWSAAVMLANLFVTRKRQMNRRNRRKKKAKPEAVLEPEAETVPEAEAEAEPKPEETAL
ncbi:MAG: hypothetical protein J5758_02705 [Abditibacteriota bacterium]|nr:hypothetical protein [Abditibacteriota bacterium]